MSWLELPDQLWVNHAAQESGEASATAAQLGSGRAQMVDARAMVNGATTPSRRVGAVRI